MGRIFLEHLSGGTLYSCKGCNTFLTNKLELVSMRFTGATGKAYLFKRAVNILKSEVQDRLMLTGRHKVRDVSCKNCQVKLGWVYEFAQNESQRYKEGYVILERALITESEGFLEDKIKEQDELERRRRQTRRQQNRQQQIIHDDLDHD